MESKRPSLLKPILVSVCNLNFLGIGYLLIGKKKRWMIAFGASLAILLIAYLTNASKNPWLWGCIFLAAMLAMAVDMWLLLKKEPTLCDGILKDNLTLLIITASLLVVLTGGGFYFYRWLGADLYRQGVLAYQDDDLDTAFKDLYSVSYLYRLSLNPVVLDAQDRLGEISLIIDSQNRVTAGDFIVASDMVEKFEEFYSDSPKIEDVKNIGVDAYIGAAQQLTASGEYEASLEKIQTVRKILPVQAEARKTEIDEVLAANYLSWGEDEYQQANYETAIEKFEIVISEYAESESLEDAYAGAALAHFDYAVEFDGAKEYDLAWEHYTSVTENYKTSEEYQEAKTRTASMLLAWGKELVSQDHFLLAMEKYDLIGDYSTESTLLAQADEENQATILLLADDTGEDGKSVLSAARSLACSGETVTDPSVAIFDEEDPGYLACSTHDGIVLAQDLIADRPGNLFYVIDRVDDDRRVQSCDYVTSYDRRTLERWQNYAEISVIDVRTGDIIYEKTFYGPSPESCPNEYWFGSMTEYLYGDDVDDEKINTWLDGVLR
ncbi:MAG: hypothetical protein GYA52_06490 [Chloroflexi bacterium]|nr:hypothetical protein [Chloroflexota bacterium]